MKKLLFAGLLVFTGLCSCNDNINSYVSGQAYVLKYGETIKDAGSGLSIALDSVLTDSRCPKDGVCIWAGNAEVRFVYSKDNNRMKFILNTLATFRTDSLINGYRIKLVNLIPYHEVGSSINQADYKAEIKITKE